MTLPGRRSTPVHCWLPALEQPEQPLQRLALAARQDVVPKFECICPVRLWLAAALQNLPSRALGNHFSSKLQMTLKTDMQHCPGVHIRLYDSKLLSPYEQYSQAYCSIGHKVALFHQHSLSCLWPLTRARQFMGVPSLSCLGAVLAGADVKARALIQSPCPVSLETC